MLPSAAPLAGRNQRHSGRRMAASAMQQQGKDSSQSAQAAVERLRQAAEEASREASASAQPVSFRRG